MGRKKALLKSGPCSGSRRELGPRARAPATFMQSVLQPRGPGTCACSRLAAAMPSSSAAWPAPKRGVQRLIAKRPASGRAGAVGRGARGSGVPYVRNAEPGRVRDERIEWKRSLSDFIAADDKKVLDMLTEDKIVLDWLGLNCPHCADGKVGPLTERVGRGWAHRCRKKGCQRFVYPHYAHPVFTCGDGQSWVSLKTQALVLFCAVVGLSHTHVHHVLGASRKLVDVIYSRLHEARKTYVEEKQRNMIFGRENAAEWVDVEADEVTLRKQEITDDNGAQAIEWEQWGGLVERGRRALRFRSPAFLRGSAPRSFC